MKALAPLQPEALGLEARSQQHDPGALRLWLRLFSCSTQIERLIANALRAQHATTLARFDYMAQLDRYPKGLGMKELSQALMVTGGNVTGLTDQLVGEGQVQRLADASDKRRLRVRLTPAGRRNFAAMAQAHQAWLQQWMQGFGEHEREALYGLLGQLRQHVAAAAVTAAAVTPTTKAAPVANAAINPAQQPMGRSSARRKPAA